MWVPTKDETGKRRYRMWGGNPRGTPEDKTRCVVSVHDTGRSPLSHQCERKRGHGPDGEYCAQHAKKLTLKTAVKWLHTNAS
jgi:hypothetical protein